MAPDLRHHYYELETRLTADVTTRMLELGQVRPDQRVLDVGCGRGEPALSAARRVGPGGRVVGIDLDEAALATARAVAAATGLGNVDFRALDGERADEAAAEVDVVTARWSLMFMGAPARALAAIARALSPGGRLVAALWAEPARVAWSTVPRQVTSTFGALPALPADGPSPFRYADVQRFDDDLAHAGLVRTHIEEQATAVVEAETGAGIVAWVRAVLPRLADAVPEVARAAWATDLARAAEGHRRGATLQLGGVTRLVVAVRRG